MEDLARRMFEAATTVAQPVGLGDAAVFAAALSAAVRELADYWTDPAGLDALAAEIEGLR